MGLSYSSPARSVLCLKVLRGMNSLVDTEQIDCVRAKGAEHSPPASPAADLPLAFAIKHSRNRLIYSSPSHILRLIKRVLSTVTAPTSCVSQGTGVNKLLEIRIPKTVASIMENFLISSLVTRGSPLLGGCSLFRNSGSFYPGIPACPRVLSTAEWGSTGLSPMDVTWREWS